MPFFLSSTLFQLSSLSVTFICLCVLRCQLKDKLLQKRNKGNKMANKFVRRDEGVTKCTSQQKERERERENRLSLTNHADSGERNELARKKREIDRHACKMNERLFLLSLVLGNEGKRVGVRNSTVTPLASFSLVLSLIIVLLQLFYYYFSAVAASPNLAVVLIDLLSLCL